MLEASGAGRPAASESAPVADSRRPIVALASASASVSAMATDRRVGPRVDASWTGNAAPVYPGLARRMGEQGEVRLDVHVGADGSVLEVRLRTSSGSSALDHSAMEAVRTWRFRPATVDGQAVPEWYRDWKWVFRLEG
jgi:protein TonB